MDSKRRWERIARHEPYYAVIAEERFLADRLTPDAEAEFFRSGAGAVERILDVVRQRVAPGLEPVSVLEFGCGPGRLAIPLARLARSVTAVDVAPSMLALAERNASHAGATNIEWMSTGDLFASERTFDLISACRVFQHIPRREGIEILGGILQKLEPGGVAVLQFPYRRSGSWRRGAGHFLRARVPGANRAANLLMQRGAHVPLLVPYLYPLEEIFALLRANGCGQPYVEFEREGDAEIVWIFVRKKWLAGRPEREPAAQPSATQPGELIDVRELIARTSIEEMNRAAEEYFASLREWDFHLSKPYAGIDDASQILVSFGTLLSGLQLRPGHTVLEFGAGSGWLSHALTQLGCRAILLDVAPSALQIARALYERHPVFGDRPPPTFLTYDGRSIGLPDASVDRIVSFDAFHHAPNPDEVIAEFARILRPGGIAAFAEPGPHHSKTAQSQFEMKTYGVVENDIDTDAIWRAAGRAGFSSIQIAAWAARPLLLSIEEYDDLLEGGTTTGRWAAWSREQLRSSRMFFLRRSGTETIDSRSREHLGSRIEATLTGGEPPSLEVTVTNRGKAVWLPSDVSPGGVALGMHLYGADGRLIEFDHHRVDLPIPAEGLAPGESVSVRFDVPPLAPGDYRLEIDCVADQIAWLSQRGSPPASVSLSVG
jgi:2-polyprenyl-3-methyl-5-hydroxy-6-metoxy-1,4-benzoquinol methylase